MQADLLGCICLDGGCCERNCRTTEGAWEDWPDGRPTKRFRLDFDPQWDDISFAANEAVEREEDKRPLKTLVGVEAWSDGRVRLWFE